jgi:protein-tyrosine phosphatase
MTRPPSSDLPAVPPRPVAAGARRVLFVCLGNICRSPLAQGVLEHQATARGVRDRLTIASCGTGSWHVGQPPDPRTIDVARRHGVALRSRARALDPACDFTAFDLLLAMDRRNLRDILRAGGPPGKAALFLQFAPPELAARYGHDVPDPYHGGPEGFDEVYSLVRAGAEGLLDAMFPRP